MGGRGLGSSGLGFARDGQDFECEGREELFGSSLAGRDKEGTSVNGFSDESCHKLIFSPDIAVEVASGP